MHDTKLHKDMSKIYYYCHPESDSLWSSNNPPEIEFQGSDGFVEELTYSEAKDWQIKLGLEEIPHNPS